MPIHADNGFIIVHYPTMAGEEATVTATRRLQVVMDFIDEQHKRMIDGTKPAEKFAVFRVGECILDWS